MIVRVAGMQSSFYLFVCHHFRSLPEGNLGPVKDESVSENQGDVFELVMGSYDEVSALRQIEKRVREVAAAFDIEAIEGFVEKKDMSFLGQGAGNVGALLLAARELIDLTMGKAAKIHCFDCFGCFLSIDGTEATEVPEVGKSSHRHDIADADGEVALVSVDLREVGDFPSRLVHRTFSPEEGAGLGREESGEESDQGAFACPVGAEKGQPLAAVDREGDVAQGLLVPVLEGNIVEIELMVDVVHDGSSQVKEISSVTSPRPQMVWKRPGRPSGSRRICVAVSGVSSGQTMKTVRITSFPSGK